MKFEVNIEKRYAVTIIALLVLALGIYFVHAFGGFQPNVMGHSAGELDLSGGVDGNAIFNGNVGIKNSNPAHSLEVGGSIRIGSDSSVCDSSNAGVIRWDGNSFQGCDGSGWVDLGVGSGGGFDLVNGQHSSSQCTSIGGTVIGDGSGNNFCRISGSSCTSIGWVQYQSWSQTSPVSVTCTSSTRQGQYLVCQSGGTHSCTTSSHSWSNLAQETCSTGYSNCGIGDCPKIAYATITQIGCY